MNWDFVHPPGGWLEAGHSILFLGTLKRLFLFRVFFLTSGGPSEGEEKKDKKGLLFRCSGSEDVGGLGIRNTGTLESWKTLFDSSCFFVLSALVAGQLAETLCQQRWSFGSQTQLYPCVIKWIDSKGPFVLGCLSSSSWIKVDGLSSCVVNLWAILCNC